MGTHPGLAADGVFQVEDHGIVDPGFLWGSSASPARPELAAPDEVYERDQKDWNTRPR